jgi:tubulin---tyrosine ligase
MTASSWITKQPLSVLVTNVKPSCDFEVDYAEFLDDALVEAWELQASFQKNEDKEPADREWWILKPGMSDRGQGVRLFSTEAELQSIFEQWEAERPDSDNEEETNEEEESTVEESRQENSNSDYIMTSQLRHFVAQPYIHPPLLLPSFPHKFHIRTYVLAVSSLKVYVYRPMLALFASRPYTAPWTSSSLSSPSSLLVHLTNTCLQDGTRDGAVQGFWSLPDAIPSLSSSQPAGVDDWREHVFSQICNVTGEIFEAAARGMMVHFQTLPNAFEVFGVDFLVDAEGTAWLLEVNAFPDFKQTGEELKGLVRGLWEGVVDVAVAPFFGVETVKRENGEGNGMVLVADLDLGRR